MASNIVWNRNTELRKVGEGDLYKLINKLGCNWRKVMAKVPKDPRDIDVENYALKYELSHIKMIEKNSNGDNDAVKIFLDEWKTSGKYRPTLETLNKLVRKLGLYGEMCAMAELLGDPLPERPASGPGAPNQESITLLLEDKGRNNGDLENLLDEMNAPNSEDLEISSGYNKNIDKKHELCEINCNKIMPNFQSSEIEVTDMIKFSSDVIVESAHLPTVIKGNIIKIPISSAQETLTFSTSESTQSSEDVNLNNTIFPTCISSLNRSSNGIQMSESDNQPRETFNSDCVNNSAYSDNCNIPAMVISLNRSEEKKSNSGTTYKYSKLKEMARNFADDSDVKNGIGGLIGKGGFGKVYAGFDVENRPIAIKRFIADNVTESILVRLFQKEIEIIPLQFKNLVRILGYSDDGPEKLVASEYIEGGSLEDNLFMKTLNETERLKILNGCAEALQFLHHGMPKKYVHRDVTSSNILLTLDRTPKLCDFGLMKEINSQDNDVVDSQLIGTPAYMDPEAHRTAVSPLIDIYSFGIVILEVITGLKPLLQSEPNVKYIKCFIEEKLLQNDDKFDISPLVDEVVKGWPTANRLYGIAKKCLANIEVRVDSRELCTLFQNL